MEQLASCCLHLVACRLIRNAWLLLGWSSRSVLWLHEDAAVVGKELERFRYHQALDRKAQEQMHQPVLSQMVDASQFRCVSVQQLEWALDAEGGVSLRLQGFLSKKHARVTNTEV
eukprot:11341761-Alexandrium_andersonii.AAC.1